MKYIKMLLILVCLGSITGFYLYTKPVSSTAAKKVDLAVPSKELFNEFSGNEEAANKKYLDKVVSISGKITGIAVEDGLSIITLQTTSDMFGVICKMEGNDAAVKKLKTGDEVHIKGVCTGMLMDVVMIRCVVE